MFPVVILVLASVLAYSNTLENGFQFDDLYRVQGNPGVQEFWSPLRHFADESTSATLPRLRQYRPLLPLSLSVNYGVEPPLTAIIQAVTNALNGEASW